MPAWTELTLEKAKLEDEDIVARWFAVLETLPTTTHLRIKASGSWLGFGGMFPPCGPDGLSGLSFADTQLIVTTCPVGALIGKLGGSSASLGTPAATGETDLLAETKPFAIGSHCVIKIPDGTAGPLFIGFNTVFRPVRVTSLEVSIAKPG